jgi:predicted enzyme related to lactoylglutathione lyase
MRGTDPVYGERVITGTHAMFYSQDPDADRDFMRDVLGWPFVHAAGPDDPWLIFRLPPAELGVHPTDNEPSTALYLLCDDLLVTIAEMAERGVHFTVEPQNRGWGIVTAIRLPSGAELGLYAPRHTTAHDA